MADPVVGRVAEIRALYNNARSAVMSGAVWEGGQPDGVTKDEALDYAAGFFESNGFDELVAELAAATARADTAERWALDLSHEHSLSCVIRKGRFECDCTRGNTVITYRRAVAEREMER